MKELVANASLKASYKCILTPKQLYEWGTKNINGIFLFYVCSKTVCENCFKYDLDNQYNSLANTANRTRSHHSFISAHCSSIKMRQVSSDEIFSNVSATSGATSSYISEFQPGKHVACLYDDRCILGQ